jgi:hypothetical protein
MWCMLSVRATEPTHTKNIFGHVVADKHSVERHLAKVLNGEPIEGSPSITLWRHKGLSLLQSIRRCVPKDNRAILHRPSDTIAH